MDIVPALVSPSPRKVLHEVPRTTQRRILSRFHPDDAGMKSLRASSSPFQLLRRLPKVFQESLGQPQEDVLEVCVCQRAELAILVDGATEVLGLAVGLLFEIGHGDVGEVVRVAEHETHDGAVGDQENEEGYAAAEDLARAAEEKELLEECKVAGHEAMLFDIRVKGSQVGRVDSSHAYPSFSDAELFVDESHEWLGKVGKVFAKHLQFMRRWKVWTLE